MPRKCNPMEQARRDLVDAVCDERDILRAQVAFVRKWAACQAGLSRVRIEDVRELIDTLDVFDKEKP